MSCSIEGCKEPSTSPIDLSSLAGRETENMGPWIALACDFHAQALLSGESYELVDGGRIRLGANVPPRILDLRLVDRGLDRPTLILRLGHDGIVSQEVPIQISTELKNHLWLNNESELAKEIDRNKLADE